MKPAAEPDANDPTQLLLAEAGSDFLLDPPARLKRGDVWAWRPLTHVRMLAGLLFEEQGPQVALGYLKKTFPEQFDVSGLEPLACEALAEIVNLWGICHRRLGSFEVAIDLFDTVIALTRRTTILQHAHYNRGFAQLQRAIAKADPRSPGFSPRQSPRHLRDAERDLVKATELDAQDAAAWAQLGTVRLLRGSNTTLRIGKRLLAYHGAVAAYERCLEYETNEGERMSCIGNMKLAQAGIGLFSNAGWLRRLGKSSEGPVMPTEDTLSIVQKLDGG